MKAKVKATGQVINVEIDMNIQPVAGNGVSHIFRDHDGKRYADIELDFRNLYPDWQQVRVQASIAAMQGLISNSSNHNTVENFTSLSVELADALVKKLQEKMGVNNE